MVAFWLGTFAVPGRVASLAAMTEAHGWDGLALTDSQNLSGDTFVALGVAAQATTRITLATAATNPGTRHPAVIASAMASLQVESNGRAFLGIARGDSALAYIGRKPLPLDTFARSLADIRTYLSGGVVDCDGLASQIRWIETSGFPRVPMSVSATGPKVIELAAGVADAITFSVGADPVRLQACIAIARDARQRAGLPELRFGAYVNAVAHPDIRVARDLVRGRMGVYARFSTMDRNVLNSLSAADRKVADELVSAYDMQSHAASGARHEAALTDEFVDRFGIVGPANHVAARLADLIDLGLDHVVVVGHSRNTPADVFADSSQRFGEEVIPAVKHALSERPA